MTTPTSAATDPIDNRFCPGSSSALLNIDFEAMS
jgi:hypothetical protein